MGQDDEQPINVERIQHTSTKVIKDSLMDGRHWRHFVDKVQGAFGSNPEIIVTEDVEMKLAQTRPSEEIVVDFIKSYLSESEPLFNPETHHEVDEEDEIAVEFLPAPTRRAARPSLEDMAMILQQVVDEDEKPRRTSLDDVTDFLTEFLHQSQCTNDLINTQLPGLKISDTPDFGSAGLDDSGFAGSPHKPFVGANQHSPATAFTSGNSPGGSFDEPPSPVHTIDYLRNSQIMVDNDIGRQVSGASTITNPPVSPSSDHSSFFGTDSAPHSPSASRKKSKLYECQYCPKTFTDRSNFKRHVRVHTGEKPFKCKHCNQAFNHPSNRKKHESTCTKHE